jgi:ubiquinone/menaquinone biosynthesis C-methylase UbiE
MPPLDLNPGSTVKVKAVSVETIPNHHRHHGGFAGASGLAAAVLFLARRGDRAELAVRLTDVGPGDTVVDIGCGPGVATRLAASRGATAIGVDPATVMLKVARVASRHRRVRYEVGAAESLPVDDGIATVAWSVATVHHWQDIGAGVAEVHRILRPSGRFLALEARTTPGATGHASHGWTRDQAQRFADHLTAHGFTGATIDEHPGHRPMISVLAVRD